jgi:hypothetical protein
MLLPKFTLSQSFRLIAMGAIVSVVLAEAWQDKAWAVALTLSVGLALGVVLLSAVAYWLFWGLGWYLTRRAKGALSQLEGETP